MRTSAHQHSSQVLGKEKLKFRQVKMLWKISAISHIC
jgi:hypothetical protein